jgi:hypothetical protein
MGRQGIHTSCSCERFFKVAIEILQNKGEDNIKVQLEKYAANVIRMKLTQDHV